MHEAALALEIVDLLTPYEQDLATITRITLEVGELTCVDPSALVTALQTTLQGSIAQDAVIECLTPKASASCQTCGHTYQPSDRISPCPHCGSFDKKWLSGQTFKIKSIEGQTRLAR